MSQAPVVHFLQFTNGETKRKVPVTSNKFKPPKI